LVDKLATNFFFNNFQNSQEQILIEDLIIESIKIYGHDLYFIPRSPIQIDKVLGEDPLREYNDAIPIEMYIKNIEGFAGEGDFLSKFNIQIRDQITFSVARRSFGAEVTTQLDVDRPREGDLIYFPLNRKIFEIKFVEHEAIFYQLGALQMWDIKCELFEYNNEYFSTGIDDIDRLMADYSIGMDMFGIQLENGFNLTDEEEYSIIQESYDINENDDLAVNDEFQTEGASFIDFTERDPFSEGTY
jgi:hypothetical protein